MKVLTVYHKVDYDGVFSLMISKLYHSQLLDIELNDSLGYNYGEPIPEISLEYDRVVMVDISFPPDFMLQLKELNDSGVLEVIWIDHHITAMKDSETYGYDTLPGLRYDGQAAVENTWEFFFDDAEDKPLIVKLLGTYDVWNKTRFDWEGRVLPLQFALKAKYGFDLERIWEELPELFTADESGLSGIIESGVLILKYLRSTWKSAIKHYSFPCTVGEKWSGLALISTEYSSNAFGEETKNYDVCIVLNWNPMTGMFKTSMYVDPERNTDFHAGEYMKANFGGGGHRGAAGGQVPLDSFIKLLTEKKI